MATFAARIKNGSKIQTVEVHATSAEDARLQAQRQGHVMSVKRRWSLSTAATLGRGDRAMLFQRLAAMIGSRVGTGEALRLLHDTFRGRISRVAGQLRQRIENGDSLVGAMEAVGPAAFPESTLAIIRTGSQAGNMAAALKEAVRFEQENEAIKKESAKGLMPTLGGFAAGVMTLLGTTLYVVPEMEASPMVQQMGAGQLPWVTLTSNILTWVAAISTFFVVLALVLTKVMRPIIPAAVDRLIIRIPFFKDVVLARKNYIAFYGLAILLRSGLRVEEALRLSRDSAERGQTKNDFAAALQAVRDGRPWPNAMTSLHPTDQAALGTSQDRSQVADSVEAIATQYRDIYRIRVEQLMPTAQLGAALFLTASGVVLFGAVILPLLQMTEAAMGGM
ncbi:type II secretion system F family protein [Thioalkalivibrio sp. ALE16]|uniref:type II secretion system F family protein n=1 Tax=Thioalkalivibrio sp. ALE16 TaxID=1158172 RepID=UPI00036C4A8F|nr:type II secretion system F family protein [Thioalkalivibrio sp. ALE16]